MVVIVLLIAWLGLMTELNRRRINKFSSGKLERKSVKEKKEKEKEKK